MAHIQSTRGDDFDQARFNDLLDEIERRGYSVRNYDARVTCREGYSENPRITFEIVQMPKEAELG